MKVYKYKLPDGSIFESIEEHTPEEIEAIVAAFDARFDQPERAGIDRAEKNLREKMDWFSPRAKRRAGAAARTAAGKRPRRKSAAE